MTDLKQELIDIIERRLLTAFFQPITSVNQKKIIGYEALIRGPSDSPLHSPFNLFEIAERNKKQAALEYICREVTIKQFAALQLPGKLFINVSPKVLLETDFRTGETLKFIQASGLHPSSVIIELTEHQPTDNYEIMREAVTHYRKMGFEIALDDLGAGYSGLRLWSELHPEYVKIDKHFVQGLQEDSVKMNFVRSIQNMATAMHCKVIAEGIETAEEFQAILKIGISYAQGFYFARPQANPPLELDSKLFINQTIPDSAMEWHSSKTAADIAINISPVLAAMSVFKVLERFQQEKELSAIPLLDKDIPCGLIFRDKFLSKLFSSRYGIELHGKQPIQTFISNTPFIVDKSTPLEVVSKLLTASMRSEQAFLVTDNGAYFGVATLLDLLEEITCQQIENAKHANPLTLLPGSVPINERMNRYLAEGRQFAVAYFDLDHFKPYNDIYGYDAGDEIIKAVANILIQLVPYDAGYIGHIGGDDFIAILTCADWLERIQTALTVFGERVETFYKAEDVANAGMYGEDRQGNQQFYPLLSLSIGLLDGFTTERCHSHVDIADLASEAKKQAKKLPGNRYFINRRFKPLSEKIDKTSPRLIDESNLEFQDH